jgi:hypothetical protein
VPLEDDEDQDDDEESEGHEVVVIEMTEKYITCLNSWGADWGHNGTFRVEKANVFAYPMFHDVFWTSEDLLPCEQESYNAKLERSQWNTSMYLCTNCKKITENVNTVKLVYVFPYWVLLSFMEFFDSHLSFISAADGDA